MGLRHKSSDPYSKKQTVLWDILHSIEKSTTESGAKEIRELAVRIAGCVCALVRIVPSSCDSLTSKGIARASGAKFYRFVEVHALPTPVPVTYLRNATGKPKWATRYLTFGLHVAAEGKHPEHIVDQVEKALPKYEDRGCVTITARSAKESIRIRNRLTTAP